MNEQQRKKYSEQYIKIQGKLERRFLPVIKKCLVNQVSSFTEVFLSRDGNVVESDYQRVNGTEMALVLATLHVYSAIVYGSIVYKQNKNTKAGSMGYNESWTKEVLKYFLEHNGKFIKNITETTRERIRQVLSEGVEKGYGAEKLARMLNQDGLTKARALRIVRTETVRATNYANYLAANELDFLVNKQWIAAHDERTRTGHIEADGKEVELDGFFEVGIYEGKKGEERRVGTDYMEYPGDPGASASNTINCRCSMGIVPKRDRDGNLINKPEERPPLIEFEEPKENIEDLMMEILQVSVLGFLVTDILKISEPIKTFVKEIFKGIGLGGLINNFFD